MVKSKKRDVNAFKERIGNALNKKRPQKKHTKHKVVRKVSPKKTISKTAHKSTKSHTEIKTSSIDELKRYIETQHKNGNISTNRAESLTKYADLIKSKIIAGASDSIIQQMTENLKKQWVQAHEENKNKPKEQKKPVHHAVHHAQNPVVQHKSVPVVHHTSKPAIHHTQHHQNRSVVHKTTHPTIHKTAHISKPHIQKTENHSEQIPENNQTNTRQLKSSFRTGKDVAMDFATKVHRTFDHLIKATILFGSQATGDIKASSDIDLVILIDDAAINWDLELTSWYREELAKIISEQNYGRDLHINTIRLTTWWRDLLHGDPIVLNILRHGQVLIDLAGFFNPLKALMMQGKIHATPEAVYSALQRSPQHLTRSKLSMLGAIEGVYWCMVEAAQASLITLGKLPPSPEHVTKMLHESFVQTGILKSEYVKWYRDIYVLHKQIAHGEIKHVDAKEIEAWQNRAEDFMKTLVNVIDRLIDARNNQTSNK